MTLRFYKEDGLWYYDAPADFFREGGTKGNLLMVCGADTLLDRISNNGVGVTIDMWITNDKNYDYYLRHKNEGKDQEALDAVGHAPVSSGNYYTIEKYNGVLTNGKDELWLCPILQWVVGHVPSEIYFNVVEVEIEGEKERTWYVDIPQWTGEIDPEQEYLAIDTFSTKEEAIAFAKEAFGADDEGRVLLVTG